MKDRLCILPLVGYFMAGRINFIPSRMAFSDFGVIALILYYLITYVAIRREKMRTGPLYFFIPIIILAGIIFYHDHSIGLRITGEGREGGRGSIFVLLGAFAYLCGVSLRTPSPRLLSWVPVICVAASAVSSIPYTLSTYFPRTAPYLYMFSDNINATAYTADVLDIDGIVRNQGQANVGACVAIVLLCYFPVFTWWRPSRWWIFIVALGCTALVVMGGFRSALAAYGLTVFVAICCYYSWRALLLIPPAVLAILLVTSLQSSHSIDLPEAAQRSLAFLPGNWDPEVEDTTKSSNDFRQKIIDVYLREEAFAHPLIGNGLTYNSADFENYTLLAKHHETHDGYYETKVFVTGKMFHTGWISLYDAVGLLGSVAFVFFVGSLIWVSGRMVFKKTADKSSPLFPLKVWIFCNTLPSFIAFFTVFGDFKTSVPFYCCYAIVWTHLNRLEKFGYQPDEIRQAVPFDPDRARLPVPA
jgi:hypothetical protein